MYYGIEFAQDIVKKSFEGKTDLVGKPYQDHIDRVVHCFHGKIEGLRIVACLHDLVEDCKEWNFKLLSHFFNESIIVSLQCLTKSEGEVYEDYITRVMSDNWATQVKMADLRDNLSLWRLNKFTPGDSKRVTKYINAYQRLLKEYES